MLSQDYEERVQVVNNQRVSVMQKASVIDALRLVETGKSAKEIKEILEDEKFNACAYITVDTLKYLKKGGRVTPAAAAIGAVLNIKPVLVVLGEKLDSFAKVRGIKAAKKTMLETVNKDLNEKFGQDEMILYAVSTCSKEETEIWRQEIAEYFPGYEVQADYLSLSVTCHIGPGALAIGYAKAVK
jgi:DegV family protein with EDD domain